MHAWLASLLFVSIPGNYDTGQHQSARTGAWTYPIQQSSSLDTYPVHKAVLYHWIHYYRKHGCCHGVLYTDADVLPRSIDQLFCVFHPYFSFKTNLGLPACTCLCPASLPCRLFGHRLEGYSFRSSCPAISDCPVTDTQQKPQV